jgi:predicted peptidase
MRRNLFLFITAFLGSITAAAGVESIDYSGFTGVTGTMLLFPQSQQREIKWVNPLTKEVPGLSHHIIQSNAMGHDVGYVVFTPEGYDQSAGKRYPVIYFLHGAGGNETADAAGFSSWVSKAIHDGLIPAVICVFPNGGMSGYRGNVEKMIVEELIPQIDKGYKTIPKASSRALAGFSMGGSGSVYLSVMHPELFCAAGSMGGGPGGRRSQESGENDFNQAIEKALPVWKKNRFGFFMVNGDKDRPEAFVEFAGKLSSAGIKNEVLILYDTEHNLGHYYERSALKMIAFIGKHLKK